MDDSLRVAVVFLKFSFHRSSTFQYSDEATILFFPLLTYQEKESLLSLLMIAARCDDEIHESEQALIGGYCALMGLPTDFVPTLDEDEILNSFSEKSEITRRVVFLETLGLVLSDNKYHKNEELLINKIGTRFGLDASYIAEATSWMREMLPLYFEGFSLAGLSTSS